MTAGLVIKWGKCSSVRGALLAVCLWCTGCGAVPEYAAPQGESALPSIVSFNPCLDAILVEIAPREQVLALSHYSRDPASSSVPPERLRGYAFTSGTAEEVLSANPDIVLASTFLDPGTAAALDRLGVRVETFGSPTTVQESIDQVRRVAALTGNAQAGERLIEAMMAAAQPDSSGQREIATLLWQPGQIVPGETTLISDLLRRHGFASHSAARGLGQADFVALETLLADPPELLLIAGDSAGQSHPLLARLESTRVEAFASRLINCGGPSVIAAGARLSAIRAGLE
jgi:iron complex transport system substrate-binding protein